MTYPDHQNKLEVRITMDRILSWQSTLSIFSNFTLLICVSLSLTLNTLDAAAESREVAVYDGESLHRALLDAEPGDDIVLYPGDYKGIKTESPEDRWHYFYSHRNGTSTAPITVRSYSRDDIQQLYGNGVDGAGYVLYLTGDNWRISDLKFHTGQKGIMLDSANDNVLDNIAIYNVRDEGLHFRKSSSNNILSNCHIYDTGRSKPGFGEAVYVGTHEGDRLGDHSNNNRIGGCLLGPGVTAEAIDIKAGTVNTIVEHNSMNGADISGINFADSFIDVKGDEIIVRFNQMNWQGNGHMDHGIHVLKRDHYNSNIYQNTVTLGSGMAFLKIGQGTARAVDNQLNYSGQLASTYSSGAVTNRLESNLPAVHDYTGYQETSRDEDEGEPTSGPTACLSLERDEKIEIDLEQHNCVDIPVDLAGRLLQVWDSNSNSSCNFRGQIISSSNAAKWTITANYAGTRNMNGRSVRVEPSNGCMYLIMRWL